MSTLTELETVLTGKVLTALDAGVAFAKSVLDYLNNIKDMPSPDHIQELISTLESHVKAQEDAQAEVSALIKPAPVVE